MSAAGNPVMKLPRLLLRSSLPVACYLEKSKWNIKLLPQQGDSPSPNPSTCEHCLLLAAPHPCLHPPLVSLLPGNQQLKMQPLKSLSALQLWYGHPVPSSKSEQDQHLTPDFKTRDYATAKWGWNLRQWGQQSLGPEQRSRQTACRTSLTQAKNFFSSKGWLWGFSWACTWCWDVLWSSG